MKKKYIEPRIVALEIEPTTLCSLSDWHVDHTEDHDTPIIDDPSQGKIIYDKGKGQMGDYDPFEEENW